MYIYIYIHGLTWQKSPEFAQALVMTGSKGSNNASRNLLHFSPLLWLAFLCLHYILRQTLPCGCKRASNSSKLHGILMLSVSEGRTFPLLKKGLWLGLLGCGNHPWTSHSVLGYQGLWEHLFLKGIAREAESLTKEKMERKYWAGDDTSRCRISRGSWVLGVSTWIKRLEMELWLHHWLTVRAQAEHATSLVLSFLICQKHGLGLVGTVNCKHFKI